jgi:hypothetical protein
MMTIHKCVITCSSQRFRKEITVGQGDNVFGCVKSVCQIATGALAA